MLSIFLVLYYLIRLYCPLMKLEFILYLLYSLTLGTPFLSIIRHLIVSLIYVSYRVNNLEG